MIENNTQTNLELSASFGYRHIKFEPPILSKDLNGMPYPETKLPDGYSEKTHHAWTPSSIWMKNIHTESIDWRVEAFSGGYNTDEKFSMYATCLANHIGGVVLNPTSFEFKG